MKIVSRVIISSVFGMLGVGLYAADSHTDVPLGVVTPGQGVGATATPPGTPLTGGITSAGGWPWIQITLVSFNATVPFSYSGTHTSTFAGTYTVSGGEGGSSAPLTWDMTATGDLGKWLADKAITGVGDVEKTDPTGPFSNNLHYAGTGTPELATFKVNTSTAKDIDKNSATSEERDAGLDEASTEWKVPAGTGTITQGGFTAVFTPSSDVRQGITIEATVHEGKTLSYTDNNYDEAVTKKWSETLTTFKVGVTLNPGNAIIYEDDSRDSLSASLGTASLAGTGIIDFTGLFATPGQLETGGELPTKRASWKAIAASSGGQLTGIRKSIKYTPSLIASGSYRIYIITAGPLPLGNTPLQGVLISYLGKASGYIEAGFQLVGALSGTLDASSLIVGNSVIENESAKEIGVQVTLADRGPKTADLSVLSIAGALVTAGPGDTIQGSIAAKGTHRVNDNSYFSEAFVRIQEPEAVSASVKTTKPVYGD